MTVALPRAHEVRGRWGEVREGCRVRIGQDRNPRIRRGCSIGRNARSQRGCSIGRSYRRVIAAALDLLTVTWTSRKASAGSIDRSRTQLGSMYTRMV